MRTAVEGLGSQYFGLALRTGPDAPRARKIPAGAGGALQVFAVKSLWHRGAYQGDVAENQYCLLHPLLIKANKK